MILSLSARPEVFYTVIEDEFKPTTDMNTMLFTVATQPTKRQNKMCITLYWKLKKDNTEFIMGRTCVVTLMVLVVFQIADKKLHRNFDLLGSMLWTPKPEIIIMKKNVMTTFNCRVFGYRTLYLNVPIKMQIRLVKFMRLMLPRSILHTRTTNFLNFKSSSTQNKVRVYFNDKNLGTLVICMLQ